MVYRIQTLTHHKVLDNEVLHAKMSNQMECEHRKFQFNGERLRNVIKLSAGMDIYAPSLEFCET